MIINNYKKAIISILLITSMILTTIPTTLAYNNENKLQNIKTGYIYTIWYVDDDRNPGWYDNNHLRTISQAISKSFPGDRIIVYMGYYKENIVINKMLNITGYGADTYPPGIEGVNNTIIDGDYKDHTVKITADGVQISGFKIINSGNDKSGIFASSCHYNSILLNNLTKNYIGLTLDASNGNIIRYNTICHNQNYGIRLYQCRMNDITANEIFNNSFDGVKIDFTATYNNLNGNEVYNNKENGILIDAASRSNNVISNTIEGNSVGVKCIGTSDNNVYYHNDFNENGQNALDTSKDVWNSDFGKGNHWSDFDEPSEGAWDNDSDGIIDTAYIVPGGDNEDNFPLAEGTQPNPPEIYCYDDNPIEINEPYLFHVWTPDNVYEEVSYIIRWGDGTFEQTSIVNSENGIDISHVYTEKNTFVAKAYAFADIKGEGESDNKLWSPRSNLLSLVVPKNNVKNVFNNPNDFFKNLLSNDYLISFIKFLEKNHNHIIFN